MKFITKTLSAGVVLAALASAASGLSVRAEPATKDIVDTAVAAGSFKTLAAALQAADLVGTLKGQGPFTVFAPTDIARGHPEVDADPDVSRRARKAHGGRRQADLGEDRSGAAGTLQLDS